MGLETSVWICCGAATVWALAAMSGAYGFPKRAILAITVCLDVMLLAWASAHASNRVRLRQPFRQGLYTGAVFAEMLGIVVVALFLKRAGHKRYIASSVAIIVGLHFIGLWRASGLQLFLWLATLLVLAGTAGIVGGNAAERKFEVADGCLFLTGLGSALAFWIIAGATLLISDP